MLRKLLRLIQSLLCFSLCAAAQAQERIDLPDAEYCVFDGTALANEVWGFDSDQQARSALERIMRHTGLEVLPEPDQRRATC